MEKKLCLIYSEQKISNESFIEHLNTFGVIIEYIVCVNLEELFKLQVSNHIDIYLINLPSSERDLKDLIRQLNSNNKSTPVIALGSDPEQATYCFEIEGIVDFILPDNPIERFNSAIKKSIYTNKPLIQDINSHSIYFKMGRKVKKFNLNEIYYIEACGIYSKVQLPDKSYIINEIISKVEVRLPSQTFIRVHKSYIINLNSITDLDKKYVYIEEIKIPIGLRYKNNIKNLLYLIEK